jgi:catalase
VSMDKSQSQGRTGLTFADAAQAGTAVAQFIADVAKHRHFGREMDPPLI